MMKKIIPLFTTLLLLGWSMNAWSFACKTATGATIPIGGGSANVYVNLTPAVNVGQNLVVDLSTQIFCHNDYPKNRRRRGRFGEAVDRLNRGMREQGF